MSIFNAINYTTGRNWQIIDGKLLSETGIDKKNRNYKIEQ